MPHGHHIAKCLHCLKEWIAGDCVPSICPDCEAAGHKGLGIDCPKCWPADRDEKLRKAMLKAIESMLRDVAMRCGVAATPDWMRGEIERIANLLRSWQK